MANGNQVFNSQNEVVTTVTHVLNEFEKFLAQEMQGCGVVYDHAFSYESGLERFIQKSSFAGENNNPEELLIYNRNITEDSMDGLGVRARNTTGKVRYGNSVLKYSCAYSEYDLNFLYVSHSIELAEKFEVVYNSNSGLSALRELTLDMGSELGEFKYFFKPMPLTDMEIATGDGVTYKGIMGILRVRGFFFTFEGSQKVIEEIKGKVFSTFKTVEERTPNEIVSDLTIEG
jgi:hypothetical protein